MMRQKIVGSLRWDILRTLRVGGHLGATEKMILPVLRAAYLDVTRHGLRDQLVYLESRALITLNRSDLHPWSATLTRHGYDVADYQVACDAGIDRPQIGHDVEEVSR